MSACSWYMGGHVWEYAHPREVHMFRQETLGDIPVREKVKFVIQKQARTCTICKLTQDTEVGEY